MITSFNSWAKVYLKWRWLLFLIDILSTSRNQGGWLARFPSGPSDGPHSTRQFRWVSNFWTRICRFRDLDSSLRKRIICRTEAVLVLLFDFIEIFFNSSLSKRSLPIDVFLFDVNRLWWIIHFRVERRSWQINVINCWGNNKRLRKGQDDISLHLPLSPNGSHGQRVDFHSFPMRNTLITSCLNRTCQSH